MRNNKRKICRAVGAVMCTVSLLALSSCGGIKITELNERLIIEAIGIDVDGDGVYTVTVQALDSETTGGSDSDSGTGELTKNYVFKGVSVGEALNGISVHTGKTPLYSQARVLVIGSESAKQNVAETLDFFLREYTTRTDILIAISEKSAKETVSASFGKNAVGASVIENALRSGEYTGRIVSIPLYKFINLLLDEKSGAFCPVIGTAKEELADDYRVETKGTALFSDGKMRAVLSPEETRGLLCLTDRLTSADIPIKTDSGIFTLRVVGNKTKIKPPKNGGGTFTAEIVTECDITEYESSSVTMLTSEETEKARKKCEEEIKTTAENAFNTAYYENGCDFCRLERRLWLSDPGRYRMLTQGGAFSEKLSLQISVEVKIRRTGKETLYG